MPTDLTEESSPGVSFRERFPRPSFMMLTVVAALVVTPTVGLLAAELRDPEAERARLAQEADQALRADLLQHDIAPLAASSPAHAALTQLGIEVLTPTAAFALESGSATLTAAPPPPAATERALATLAPELARYPAEFLHRARLHRLLLCANLHEGTEAIPSLPNYHGTLLVDVDADAPFLTRLVHHEIFHFADYADDDQLSRDPSWLSLNDHYFVYGDGGRFRREPGAGRFRADLRGFVSSYATSALEEDKAETFAMYMAAPHQFNQLVTSDPIVAAKWRAIQTQLRRLSASLDDRFFSAR